jgi:hypothetical protein
MNIHTISSSRWTRTQPRNGNHHRRNRRLILRHELWAHRPVEKQKSNAQKDQMKKLDVVMMKKAGTVFCRGTSNDGVTAHQSNHVPSPKIQGRRQRLGAVCCDKRAFQANAKVLALKLPPQGVHVGRDLGLTIKNAVPPSHISAGMQQTNTS